MNDFQKILLVDDEPDILEFLSYNFRKRGYEVVIANNGIEGLDKVVSNNPHLIISDILMPQMNGIEMCEKIRQTENLKNIPIILLSAITDDYKVLHAMRMGADQFASKPIRFEYLLHLTVETFKEKQIQ